MSTHDWQLVLADQEGQPYTVLDQYEVFGLGLVVNGVGAWTVTTPAAALDWRWLQPDTRLLIYHRGRLLAVGFLRAWELSAAAGGPRAQLTGVDQNMLLQRRIVAYYAGTTASNKAGPADDVVKAIVRENLGALATDAERDLTAAGLTVQGDLGRGPAVDKAFAWRQTATISAEIAAVAASLADPLYYAVVPLSPTTFEFRTWSDQPGRDRTLAGPDPLLVGEAIGNMEAPVLEADYSQLANVVYAAGQGEGDQRQVVEVYDPTALAAGPVARVEQFADARQATTLNQVEDVGRAALLAATERRRFTGVLLNVPGCEFGRDWQLGDRVTAMFLEQQFDCLIGAVEIASSRTGERITAPLELDIARPRAIAVTIWAGGS